MLYVYVGCLTFGILYSVLSAVLGSHGADHGAAGHDGFGHGGFDHAGLDHAGLDHSGLDHADHGSDSADTPTPFSPVVIASAITAFGAVGIIGKLGFRMGDLPSSVFALTLAGIVGTVIFFGVVKLMYASQSNSTFSRSDLSGIEGEVLTPVPANGLGEIAYVINGMRYNMPAKSADGEAIARGEAVRIREVAGNTAVIARKLTIDDIDALEFGADKLQRDEKNKNS